MEFMLNINNEHVQDYSCPEATSAFCSHGETLPRQAGNPPLEVAHEKLMRTVTGIRPCTEAKLTPGSCEQALLLSCSGRKSTSEKMSVGSIHN